MKTLLNRIAVSVLMLSAASAVQAQPAADDPRAAPSAEFPYDSRFVEVDGATMHYVEEGEGAPILFLHGNPTSAYLWRNIIPYVSDQGRAIAVDLIGFGQSDKVEGAYTFQDHYGYVEGFVEALGLEDVTLVVHDWGSALGLYYAANNSDNVAAVAFMEALTPPAFPMPSLEAMGPYADLFRAFRTPDEGRALIIDQNFFIEQLMPQAILRPLSDAEMDAYRAPFLDAADREPIYVWPNEIPIAGQPARNVAVVDAIGQWLATSDQPKLVLYASPGALTPPEAVAWMAENFSNLQTRFIGNGVHYLQEDEPEAIGRNLSDWLRDHVQ